MRARPALILTLFVLLNAPPQARAQCPDWIAGPLDNGTVLNGTDGTINSVISWDPDSTGPLPARLVVGGAFTSIGGVAITNVAQRDPVTGVWSEVGGGLASTVNTLHVFNGQLFAGGSGDNNVGTFDITVHRFDGSAWQDLPATNTGNVLTMGEYNGSLYIGGSFMTHFAVGNPAFFLARWNSGASLWEDVESGIGQQTNTAVRAIASYNGDLYVGGNIIGGPGTVIDIAHWNAATHWTQVTTGTDLGSVNAFAIFSGELIVAGGFATINGVTRSSIAGWNGSSFHNFSTGTGGPSGGTILTVTIYNGIVIGGLFTTAGGTTVNHIALWPPGGSAWQALGGGTNGSVKDATYYNGALVAAGPFTQATGQANHIAFWDGTQWGSFGGGSGNYVLAMTVFNGRMVAGGDFNQSTVALSNAHNIAGWNGGSALTFGSGMNGPVEALMAFKYPGSHGSNELVAGGIFSLAGGVAASNIARWDESLLGFPPPAWAPMGAGFNSVVNAIERYNGVTYAGGTFTASGGTSLLRIARWNETTDVWEPVGTGMNGNVFAMKVWNGSLYVGGNFTTAGGVSAHGLARWDGTNWSAVGSMFFDGVLSLEIYNGNLIIGGQFAGSPGSPNIVQFDGAFFTTLGTGGINNNVRALRTNGTRLYAGGDFSAAGGVPVDHIAYWDGAWHGLHYGTDNIVFALASFHDEVHAGGEFQIVDFGGPPETVVSPFWGRFSQTGLPWFTQFPFSNSVNLGQNATFSAQVGGGFTGLTYHWFHNDVAMSDGVTPYGSSISGALTPSLTITGALWPDSGSYRMEATNACGTVSTIAAVLTITSTTGVPTAAIGATVFESLGPNPTPGASRMAFSLGRDAAVKVRIYDVAGRLVRGVDVGHLAAGRHLAGWDGRDDNGQRVSAAPYFVRLEVDGRPVGVKRLIIMQ